MIKDRLVVGIRDKALSERLQLDAELTLEKAKTAIRQHEAVQDNRGVAKSTPITLDSLKGRPKHPSSKPPYPRKQALPSQRRDSYKQCTRCGKGSHKRDKCPARDATCHKCHKKGHYSAQCFSKVDTVTTETTHREATYLSSDESFLDTIETEHSTAWMVKLKLGTEILFKLDTGAEATAVSDECYQALGKPHLTHPGKILYGPGRQTLDVVGQLETTLYYKGQSSKQQLFVVRGLNTNLLGLPAIVALNLAARLDATADYTSLIHDSFPSVFEGLGNLGEPYSIKLKPDAKPHALFTARTVPLPLRTKVQSQLAAMEKQGVISPVTQPTPWCAGMVAVPKKSGSVRICVDLKRLNESVLREVYPLPKVDHTLAQLSGATVFSRLDANSGFWQIPLSDDSRLLTTFITPFGRFCYNKLPFGISSAPEHFQMRMSKILSGLQGVVCHMDDVLIFGQDKTEHDNILAAVLTTLQSAGVTLNKDKCLFGQDRLTFLGHVVDRNGISADPEKITALTKMKSPDGVSELRRFLGMANQLGKFSPSLATITQPLRELLSKRNSWCWNTEQEAAFDATKQELVKHTVLALYNPTAPTKVSADASSFGLGAVLLQHDTKQWRPVAFASRSLSEVERRYAQIEKEALATTWACEKFVDYLLGAKFTIETDHKPLVPLLSTTHLNSLPPRVLRFRLRMNRFDYDICHVPGKDLYTADALSRAPTAEPGKNSVAFQSEIEMFVEAVTSAIPASDSRLKEYLEHQKSDPVCSLIRSYCAQGWPVQSKISTNMQPYWEVRSELTVCNDLLLRGSRIVVPVSLQEQTLHKIHHGHQGIQKCRARANSAVWWPRMSEQISNAVSTCPECVRKSNQCREPMIATNLPDYPWQIVGSDLFHHKGTTYLLIVDYFSRYPEIVRLTDTTSKGLISALKPIFARHGVPVVLRSDNGPQYVSREMSEFAISYGFTQVTSSPHYPRSNGLAERTVKTVKAMLEKSSDPYLALLSYRSTELSWCNLSPSQLLMGRKIRSTLPEVPQNLLPQWQYLEAFREADKAHKEKQKQCYDKSHRAHSLPEIPNDEAVWVNTDSQQELGRTVSTSSTPRSYLVEVPSGTVRRNRQHLIPVPQSDNLSQSSESQDFRQSPIQTRSRTGTRIHPPDKLNL